MNYETEHLLYDFTSFVSEFGGALGLFLGFSFLMVLEMITPFIIIVKKAIKRY